jgi:hypothetical protein
VSTILESDDGVDLRKGARLTRGATLSVMVRKEDAHSLARAGPAALAGLGPKREAEEGKMGRAQGKESEQVACGRSGRG